MGHGRESLDLRRVGVSSHREAHRVGGPKAKENQVGVVRVEWEQGKPGGLPEYRREEPVAIEATGVSKASPELSFWALLRQETGNRSSVLVGSRSVHREGVKTVTSMLRTCLSPFPGLSVSVFVSGAVFGWTRVKMGEGRDGDMDRR